MFGWFRMYNAKPFIDRLPIKVDQCNVGGASISKSIAKGNSVID